MELKKRTFLLLEILIALSLMGMLLSLLFSFLVQSVKVEKKLEKGRIELLQRQNLHIRIQDLLTTLKVGGRAAPLYTQKFPKEEFTSLVALYDNGIDPEPQFSGAVLGRLHIDEEKNLCLTYWPIDTGEKESAWRKEILFSNVTDLHLSFLNPDEKESFLRSSKPKVAWDHSWPKGRRDPPSIIKMGFKGNGEMLEFTFRLPNTHPIPTYIEKGLST